MLQIGDIVQGEVSSIAFGGEGIIRHDKFVIFVPFSAVGESVRVCILSLHHSFARAKLLEVLRPAATRITARCPYFGVCGGCQFQHLTMAEQAKIKRQLLCDALARIGHLQNIDVPPIVKATQEWEYRRHITLHISAQKTNEPYAGYITLDNTSTIAVHECPIFESQSSPILPHLQNLIAKLELSAEHKGRVSLFKDNWGKWICHLQFAKAPKNCAQLLSQEVKTGSIFTGAMLSTKKECLQWGIVHIPFSIDVFNFTASPRAFLQNHPEQSANIYRYVCQLAEHIQAQKILDLYCGIGITSCMLAKNNTRIIGTEFSKEAIKQARANAQRNFVTTATFIQDDVEKVLKAQLEKEKPELVLTNPPREGLSSLIVQHLLDYAPEHIIYISCMPATLARDLKALCQSTYEIQSILPFDMFPQTTHLETVVYIRRTK